MATQNSVATSNATKHQISISDNQVENYNPTDELYAPFQSLSGASAALQPPFRACSMPPLVQDEFNTQMDPYNSITNKL